jgi:hypothetical protein
MTHRSTNTGFAVLVTMLLPIGAALAQGGPAPAGTAGAGAPAGTVGGGAGSTTGIGNASSINSGPAAGTTAAPSPPLAGQSYAAAPVAVQGFAEQEQISPTGRAVPGPDGVSTRIVPARPCSVAARETDGTTTCVGIPAKLEATYTARRSRHRRG